MKKTSPFSATMIGVHENASSNPAREIFLMEAREVMNYTKDVHHSRKISHQQVNYPDTVQKLSQIMSSTSQLHLSNSYSTVTPELNPRESHKILNMEQKAVSLKEHQEKLKEYMVQERHLNERKRLYNRELGRKAVVNQVISGTAPEGKSYLFPCKASHEQILALTGTLKAPNPFIVPPEVPRPKKWKGDGEGWSVN